MPHTSINLLLLALSVAALSGCSFKEASYHTLHNIAKQECRKIVNTEERMECEANHTESYHRYKTRTAEEASTH